MPVKRVAFRCIPAIIVTPKLSESPDSNMQSAGSTDFIIAVVDDDQRTLESLENLLESAGHTVRLFAYAAALLESGILEEIDCLISDVGMPGMDGLELLHLAHGVRPELPVILITGRPALLLRRSSPMDRDYYELLEKPLNGQELLTTVNRALRDSHPYQA
jgi:FixJ family two-component response regulator